MNIIDKYNSRADKVNSLVCVGLDSEFEKLKGESQFSFNKKIIDQTHEHVASYKLNIAFYEARGDEGLRELKKTMDYLRENYPDIFTICDAKRGDIGNTNNGYVTEILDWLEFDAMTLHPYMGKESLMPFLERKDKFFFVLCRTSNPGAGEFQNLSGRTAGSDEAVRPLWALVAEHVSTWGDNCGLVVGATAPKELKQTRKLVGDMTFLVPGIGAQGGSVQETVEAGLNSQNKGLVIHSARGIIFSDDPKRETIKLQKEINSYRL